MASFSLFSTLPTEIRLEIWQEILLSTPPQVLEIYTICFPNPSTEADHYRGFDSHGEIIPDSCYRWLHQFLPSRSPPPILHINSESRALFLPTYQLGFNYHNLTDAPPFLPKTCDHLKTVASSNRKFYWNPQKDILHYHYFPSAYIASPSNPDAFEPITTLPNTASIWYLEARALQSPRFLSVSFPMLLDWFGPLHRGPDLSSTVILGVVVEKDPRCSDYQDMAWSTHDIRIADTSTWEESERYLEGKIGEVVRGGVWKGGFRPREGMEVRVLRSLEGFVEVVEGIGSGEREGGGVVIDEVEEGKKG